MLKNLTHPFKPSFIFLIETLSDVEKISSVRHELGYDDCFAVPKGRGCRGLALLWKRDWSVKLLSFSSHHIDVEMFYGQEAPWRLTDFYGEANRGVDGNHGNY